MPSVHALMPSLMAAAGRAEIEAAPSVSGFFQVPGTRDSVLTVIWVRCKRKPVAARLPGEFSRHSGVMRRSGSEPQALPHHVIPLDAQATIFRNMDCKGLVSSP